MKFKIKDIVKHELIGLHTRIADSKNKANIGLAGKIINETKKTIIIKTKKGKKMVFKNNVKLEFELNEKRITVDGSLLIGRPEDRVKK
jgi:ribonuclease P protein subunit POP4